MLSELSDTASIWVFQSDRKLNKDEVKAIHAHLDVFIPEWSAHGTNSKSDYVIVDHFFIVVGVDENFAEASGCSKDGLTRAIKGLGEQLNIDFFNRLNTAYVNGSGEIELADMMAFKALVQSDTIRRETIVFNNLIETKADLDSKWKVAVKNSWHANLVPII